MTLAVLTGEIDASEVYANLPFFVVQKRNNILNQRTNKICD